MPPLNPTLFEVLQRQFGTVRISNQGQPRQVRELPDPVRFGRVQTLALVKGEQYHVDCPLCGDRRKRLYFNYLFGTPDRRTGRPNFSLVFCQHNKCHADPGRKQQLLRLLGAQQWRPMARLAEQVNAITESSSPPPAPQHLELPQNLMALTSHGPTHPVITYLHGRGFDPAELQATWSVSYCHCAFNTDPPTNCSLVAPVFQPARLFMAAETDPLELVYWQARRIVPGEPRYSNPNVPRSAILYGLVQALVSNGPIVIVEGITDAWKIGPGALALLGNVISREQLRLIVHRFASRPIVVMLDGNAHAEAVAIQRQLQTAHRLTVAPPPVARVDLPDNLDPANFPRAELWARIQEVLVER